MNNHPTRANIPSDIQREPGTVLLNNVGGNEVIKSVLETREVRQTIGNILPDILSTFSRNSGIKRYVLKLLGSYLTRQLSRSDDILEEKELQLLFQDKRFLNSIVETFPEILNWIYDLSVVIVGTVEKLPVDEKKEVLNNLISSLVTEKSAELINQFGQIIHDIHQEDPEFLTKTLGPCLTAIVDKTDFGDLKVFIEATFTDITALVKKVSDALFDKPAKIVVLLTLLPSMANTVLKITEDLIGRFNAFPPDLVTDVILSLFREVDAKTVGTLSNNVMELVRQITVGSALLGDPGMPQSRLDIAAFIEKFMEEIDLDLAWKFREAASQNKERFDLAMLAMLKKNPEMVFKRLKRAPNLRNYRVKAANQKLALLENLPQKEAFQALAEGISRIDTNLLAEWLNLSSVLINKLNHSSPDLLPGLMEEFVSTLDFYEIEESMAWAVENLREPLKPLGQVVLPGLVKMAAEWISTNGNGYDKELSQATEKIVEFLNHKEAAA